MPAESLQMQGDGEPPRQEAAAVLVERPLERAIERDENGRYVKGQSGNPAGREKGSRNRATQLMEEHFDRFSGSLAAKAVQMALEGDSAAMRLVVGRIIAPRRHRVSEFALPKLRTAEDAATAMAMIVEGVADGVLATAEAAELTQIVDTFMRALEAGAFEARLRLLEGANGLVR